jgi:hypothetical protein
VRLAAVLVILLAVGCGSTGRHFAVSSDGRAVLRDSYDGHLDHDWSCGSLRAATRRLPVDGPIYSTIPGMLFRAEGSACDYALATLERGVTRDRTRLALGRPDRSPRCWLYRWSPNTASAVDGARICFSNGRVSFIETAVHG